MSERPKRIQRQRTKGWRMPPNTVYVGRPTKWGNPHKVGVSLARHSNGRDWRWMTPSDAVAAYRKHIAHWTSAFVPPEYRRDVSELRGKNLCCWCPLDQPCHADVLLELANAAEAPR